MEGKLKVIVIVLVILLAASLFIIFNIQSARLALLREYTSIKQKLTQENEQLASKLNTALQESRSLSERLVAMEKDLERISSERDEASRKFELVNRERQELREKLNLFSQLQEELGLVKNENESLRQQLKILTASEDDLKKLREENEVLRQKIEEAKTLLKDKTLLAKYAKEQEPEPVEETQTRSVDLPPIVISTSVSRGIELPHTLEGKILNVNTEHKFVVVNLGSNKGLRENMVFEVLRGQQLIGKVKAIQIRQEITACDIIESITPFQAGDIVRY